MTTNDTIRRILYLLDLLGEDRPARSSSELADKCGVSRRTIFRDLERLKDLGIRVDTTEDGYRLRSKADLKEFFQKKRTRRRRRILKRKRQRT